MDRRRTTLMPAMLLAAFAGCGQVEHRSPEVAPPVRKKMRVWRIRAHRIRTTSMAVTSEPAALPAELAGPQPVEAFIHRALAENRTVQAAYHNVQSLKHRIPQVTALDDPVASNVVFPIPSVAPQYS